MNFMDAYRAGKITAEALDIFISYWHVQYKGNAELHEFLGMTWEQYGHWVETGEIKEQI